jgi:hypothetical protein
MKARMWARLMGDDVLPLGVAIACSNAPLLGLTTKM